MTANKAKIDKTAFQASIGVLLGIAIVLAAGRTYIRIHIFHRIFVDDCLFFLATVCLIAGTVMVYIDCPYLYTQVSVESGTRTPPSDFVQQLIDDQKTQDAAAVLLFVTVVSVKFSFLFFFHSLLRRLKNMIMWWRFVFAVHVPTAVVMICSSFMSCPNFGARVLVTCVTPSALARENAVFKAVTILDIATDVLVISIPILLLWRVQIGLRRKFALGAILSLSIFMILTSIIKISAGNIINGQIDTTWAVFWLQAEAAVAVMVVSISAFRALFIVDGSNNHKAPQQSPSSRHWLQSRSRTAHDGLPSIPSPTMTGVKTLIGHTSSRSHHRNGSVESEGICLQATGPGIRVTHDISTDRYETNGIHKPSYESFV